MAQKRSRGRKNKTKQLRTDSTPVKSKNIRGPLLEDSPGMLTRRRLEMLRGEGTSNQSTAAPPATPSTPTASVKTAGKTATKKITPKKRKRNLEDCY